MEWLLFTRHKMPKYKEYYDLMMTKYKNEFDEFREIHDSYVLDPKGAQEEFNRVGRKIQDIIREYEDRLCGHSENGQYGKFSNTLADKLWDLLRKEFVKIDYIGVISS
ncbi:hypothetical protein HY310_01650 [Candidatus Microgenomates bacterium]|nr:hypothetical protein [Candidatus Microgenomates bacterium]